MRNTFRFKTTVTVLWAATVGASAFGQADLTHGEAQGYRLTPRQQKLDATVRAAKRNVAPVQALRRDDGAINVSIRFDHELSEAEIALYEEAGVAFRTLPSGRVAGSNGIYAAWVAADALSGLADDAAVVSIEGGFDPEVRAPLDRSLTEIQADVRHSARTWTSFRGNRGAGQTVGVVDTGVDVFHPDFFHVKNTAPYNWIDVDGNGSLTPGVDAVDMNRNGQADANERLNFVERIADANASFNVYDCDTDWLYHDANGSGLRDYGTFSGFTESDDCYGERLFYTNDTNGDDRLSVGETLQSLGQSKIRKVLFGDHEYVRGVDLIETPIDTNGHGTSVCSIVVAQAAGYNRRFCGVAPEAELVVVDRYSFDASQSQANYVEMLLWMEDQGANVMLWEFGGWVGQFLDGSSHLESLITNRQLIGASVQVIPNGNLGGSGRHAQVTVPASSNATRTMTIPSSIDATVVRMSLITRADNGVPNFLVDLRKEDGSYRTLLPAAVHSIDGYAASTGYSASSRGTYRFDIVMTNTGGDPFDASDFTVRIRNTGTAPLTFHCYAKDNDTTWSGGVAWTSPVDSHLVTWPATSDVCVGVASYSTVGGDYANDVPGVISPFSGPGPRVDGTQIEAIAAPGDYSDVLCAQSQGANTVGAWAAISGFGGTSAAGPHVAGAAALLGQALPYANAMGIREALFATGKQDFFTGAVPNDRAGWGKLQVDDAYRYLADDLCQSIDPVSLDGPVSGSTGHDPDTALTLSWSHAQNAMLYDLHFGETNPPALYIQGLNITEMNVIASNLDPQTTYYWKVVAVNSCGYVSESSVRTITTGEVYVPTSDLEVYEQYVNNDFADEHVPTGSAYSVSAVQVGEQAGVIFALRNEGDDDLVLTGSPKVLLMGPGTGHFEVTYEPLEDSIAPGDWAPVAIMFKPLSQGMQVCNVMIPTSDPEGGYTFLIQGLGLPSSNDDGGNDPNEPGDVDPVDPNEPADTDPVEPNDPVDTDPIDPNVPGDTDPAEPNEPIDVDPVEPNDPIDVDPIDPIDPNVPVDADPVEPNAPVEVQPVDPNEFDGDPNAPFVDDLVPTGMCGFGAGFASMLCSLFYAGRGMCRRGRR